MRKVAADRCGSALLIPLFLKLELRDFNELTLISFCLARARARGSPAAGGCGFMHEIAAERARSVTQESRRLSREGARRLEQGRDLLNLRHCGGKAAHAAYLAGSGAAHAFVFERTARVAKTHQMMSRS